MQIDPRVPDQESWEQWARRNKAQRIAAIEQADGAADRLRRAISLTDKGIGERTGVKAGTTGRVEVSLTPADAIIIHNILTNVVLSWTEWA